jgi:uracil-DNA glycosylase
VLQAHPSARILIESQAPGRKVHASGVPFDDPSGDRLRAWLGLSRDEFYDVRRVAILPMGFCFPGSGRSGDLPPRPECAPAWRRQLLDGLREVRLTPGVGKDALEGHLGGGSVTGTVRDWRRHWPKVVPLPHPSPRNMVWRLRNPWFEAELVPLLRDRIRVVLA